MKFYIFCLRYSNINSPRSPPVKSYKDKIAELLNLKYSLFKLEEKGHKKNYKQNNLCDLDITLFVQRVVRRGEGENKKMTRNKIY